MYLTHFIEKLSLLLLLLLLTAVQRLEAPVGYISVNKNLKSNGILGFSYE